MLKPICNYSGCRVHGSGFRVHGCRVHGWLPYLHTGLCSSFFNLEPWNFEPEKFFVSVSSARSPSQILASLSDGILSESIHAPVAKPQYLQTVQSSSLSNPEPLNREPLNLSSHKNSLKPITALNLRGVRARLGL